MSLAHRCGEILAHYSLQNCFYSTTLKGFQALAACLRSCQSISIGFKSRLKFFFCLAFLRWTCWWFWISVLLHNPSALDFSIVKYCQGQNNVAYNRVSLCSHNFCIVLYATHWNFWYSFDILHTFSYYFWSFCAQLSSRIPVVPPPCRLRFVSLWRPRRCLSWGRMFLGAGGWNHLSTAHSAFGVRRLHRHSGGTREQTLSGHLQTRWAVKDVTMEYWLI